MVTYVLDASALLRFLDGDAGSERVAAILNEVILGRARVVISAIHWGEVLNILLRREGLERFAVESAHVRSFNFNIEPATAERAERAAILKFKHRIPYADAFGAELAGDSDSHILVTADFDFKPAEGVIRIEFLPRKPVPFWPPVVGAQ